jgi:hypothetical protein
VTRHSTLRASDADRDAVTERLRQAAVEGRLEPHELEERLHTALRARTYGELDRLLRDLPGKRQAAPVARTAIGLTIRLIVLFVVVSAVVVAAILSAAWWLLCAIVWLSLRAGRGGSRRSAWHQHPPRVARRRPAHPF